MLRSNVKRNQASHIGSSKDNEMLNIDLKYQSSSVLAMAQQNIEDHTMKLELDISQMTARKNKEVASDILRANQTVAALEEREHKFKKTKNINCRELMTNFNQECLKLNYLLKRETHQVLSRRTEKVEVIPNTYMNFKVVTKDQLAPGKIHFSFGDGQYVRAPRAIQR